MSFFGNYIPLEYLMSGGIGFLAACLLALMVVPAVHNRAVRLTRRRDEQLPLSIKEMRAEKDQIRAGFAAATRDLEVNIAQLRTKSTAHANDLARKAQFIDRLKTELETADVERKASEERAQNARDALLAAQRDFNARLDAADTALQESEARAQAAKAKAREALRDLDAKDQALDAAQREIAAIRAEIARLAPEGFTASPYLQPGTPDLARPTPPAEDGVTRAVVEIDSAARRLDARYEGGGLFGKRKPANYTRIFKTVR
jgi:septal ring factor EnvC (AmiA/AmiB activator)